MRASLQVKTKLTLLGGDFLLLAISLACSTYFYRGELSPVYQQYNVAAILCLLLYPLSLYLTRAYEVQPGVSSAENLRRPLLGLLLAATAASFLFFFAPDIRLVAAFLPSPTHSMPTCWSCGASGSSCACAAEACQSS